MFRNPYVLVLCLFVCWGWGGIAQPEDNARVQACDVERRVEELIGEFKAKGEPSYLDEAVKLLDGIEAKERLSGLLKVLSAAESPSVDDTLKLNLYLYRYTKDGVPARCSMWRRKLVDYIRDFRGNMPSSNEDQVILQMNRVKDGAGSDSAVLPDAFWDVVLHSDLDGPGVIPSAGKSTKEEKFEAIRKMVEKIRLMDVLNGPDFFHVLNTNNYVSPPTNGVGVSAIGMSPEEISNPEARRLYKAALSEDGVIRQIGRDNMEKEKEGKKMRKKVFGYVDSCSLMDSADRKKIRELADEYRAGDEFVVALQELFARTDIKAGRKRLEKVADDAQLDRLMDDLDGFKLDKRSDYFFGTPRDFVFREWLCVLLAVRNTGETHPDFLARQGDVEQRLIDWAMKNYRDKEYSVSRLQDALSTARNYAATDVVKKALKEACEQKRVEAWRDLDLALDRYRKNGTREDYIAVRKRMDEFPHFNADRSGVNVESFERKVRAAFVLEELKNKWDKDWRPHWTNLFDSFENDSERYPEARKTFLAIAGEMIPGTSQLQEIERKLLFAELNDDVRNYVEDGTGDPVLLATRIDELAPPISDSGDGSYGRKRDYLDLCRRLMEGLQKHGGWDSPLWKENEDKLENFIKGYCCLPERYDFSALYDQIRRFEKTPFQQRLVAMAVCIQKKVFDGVGEVLDAYRADGDMKEVARVANNLYYMPFAEAVNPGEKKADFIRRKQDFLLKLLAGVERKNKEMGSELGGVAQERKTWFGHLLILMVHLAQGGNDWGQGPDRESVIKMISESGLSDESKDEMIRRLKE